MPMTMASHTLALTLMGMVAVSQALSFYDMGSRGLFRLTGRGMATAEKQFFCNFPLNESAYTPYITCGVINETLTEYPVPVDLSYKYSPQFEYTLMCPNLTLVEDEDESESSSSSSSESESGSRSDESAEEGCLREPYTHCATQCVYRTANVLNEAGLPDESALYEHSMQLLNSDREFKKPVAEAVKICHKGMTDIVHKYGMEKLSICLLLEIVDECLEYQTAMHCPKRSRISFKKS